MIKKNLVYGIKTVDDLVALFSITDEQITSGMKHYIQQAQNDIQAIIDIPDQERTFANTALALDRISSFSDVATAIHLDEVLESLSPHAAIRDAAHEAIKQAHNFYVDAIDSNKKLFNAFRAYVEGNANTELLTAEQRYFLADTMDDFVRAGLNLPEDTLSLVRQLNKELGELGLVFERNIAQDNRTIEVSSCELTGVNSDFIASLERTPKGGYVLGTDYPTRSAIMENCDIENTRRRYFDLFMSRAYPANYDVLKQVIKKRDQLAHLLGFDSYAHLDTADNMVQNPERVYTFLYDLMKKASIKEQIELKQWLADKPESVVLDAQGRIKPWDISYLQNQYKKKHLAVDEDLIASYFPMEKTVQGLLAIYRQFLSIDFKEIPVTGLWHADVTLIGVYDKHNTIMGYLLLDLYPRDNKFSHAAHATIIPAVIENGKQVSPMVSVVMANFPKSTAHKPSLLTREDVGTFFHEFGHALHAVCGGTTMASFAGTAVKHDFVEMPSQMLEEWLWDKAVLRSLSSHYQTGEPLSDELIDNIIALKTYDSGYWIKRQLFFALISIDYFAAGADKDPQALWDALYAQMNPHVVPGIVNHSYASFGHLMDYGAKYYGYLWSKVFALDLFETIKKQGLYNAAIGQRYMQQVIGKGGSENPNDILKNFLGREPRSDAFFKSVGLE